MMRKVESCKANKNRLVVLGLVLVLVLMQLWIFSACSPKSVYVLVIDGDVERDIIEIELGNIKTQKYSYERGGEIIKTKGWHIADVIDKTKYLSTDSMLMITGKTDGTSAVIEGEITGDIYFYLDDEGDLCAKGINYPPVCSIKKIAEITVIAKEIEGQGYKVLSEKNTDFVSRGNAKLKLFEKIANNVMGTNTAKKYIPKKDRSVSSFTGKNKNVVYFNDFDIKPSADLELLDWENGGLSLVDSGKAIFGFATGTTKMIYSAYDEIKATLDEGKKVMLVLPDGLSWEQVNHYKDSLDELKPENATLALSVNLAISPVALAAIVTGQPPFKNGVFFAEGESRAVLKPVLPDIFEYAESISKKVKYLEGNGNLIISSVDPVFGLSESQIYENAKSAISEGADFIFVHFHEPDDTNHTKGPISSASLTQILYIETYVKYFKENFDGKIIVVPDHGHKTLYDPDNKAYGKHGLFTHEDMYVPYYVFSKE